MGIQYRQALPAEAILIKDFQVAMAWETEQIKLDEPTCRQGVEAVFASPSLGQYHVCVRDQQVIGSVLLLSEWSDWRNGRVLWIHSLYVKPEFRGQGVYSGLYSYVKDLAQGDPQIRGIRLYVDRRNTAAQAIYAKLGMNSDHYQLFEWMKTF